MSREKFNTILNDGRKAEVIIGWDVQMQWLFMCIFEIDDAGEEIDTIYSNLDEGNPHSLSLTHFSNVAKGYGISLNHDLLRRVKLSKLNNV